jgi:hypothetical protein
MNEQMETLLENIKKDYFEWTSRCRKLDTDGELTEINKKMIAEFNDELQYKVGNKYIKVITDRTVWGFIVNTENDKKFRKGDILKAAGWAAPARNAARGNIVDGGYTIQWTGPLYL